LSTTVTYITDVVHDNLNTKLQMTYHNVLYTTNKRIYT